MFVDFGGIRRTTPLLASNSRAMPRTTIFFVLMSAIPSKYGRPTEVMIPPANPARSMRSVLAPRRDAASAAAIPAQPPPQTRTSISRAAESDAARASGASAATTPAATTAAVAQKRPTTRLARSLREVLLSRGTGRRRAYSANAWARRPCHGKPADAFHAYSHLACLDAQSASIVSSLLSSGTDGPCINLQPHGRGAHATLVSQFPSLSPLPANVLVGVRSIRRLASRRRPSESCGPLGTRHYPDDWPR